MSRPSTVFVAGSRQISRLPSEVRSRLDTMIEKGFQILVGDANGADKAVQQYLADKSYPNVIVHFMKDHYSVERLSASRICTRSSNALPDRSAA